MKNVGIFILTIGLVITIFTGFSFFTREKVVDIGDLEITHNKKHDLTWSPFIGVAVMVAGAGIYLIGLRKR